MTATGTGPYVTAVDFLAHAGAAGPSELVCALGERYGLTDEPARSTGSGSIGFPFDQRVTSALRAMATTLSRSGTSIR